MVQVIVGLDYCKTFIAHRDLITSRSRFFAKALRTYDQDGEGNILWAEGEDGVVKLPKDDPDVFANYLHLIYFNIVPIHAEVNGEITTLPRKQFRQALEDSIEDEHGALCKLYVLCEKLGDLRSKALLITAFVEAVNIVRQDIRRYNPSPATIKTLYEGTMDNDPLRKFCVDCYAIKAGNDWFEGDSAENYNKQFLFDIMVKMAEIRKQPSDDSKIESAEAYHETLQIAESKVTEGSPVPKSTVF
jgi:hypothetical protein